MISEPAENLVPALTAEPDFFYFFPLLFISQCSSNVMTQATHAPEADRLATDAMAGRRGRDAAFAVAADARAEDTVLF